MIKLITALAVSGSLYNGLKDKSYYGEPIEGVKCSCCSHGIGKHKNHYYRKLEKPKRKIQLPKLKNPFKDNWYEPYNYADVVYGTTDE